MDEIDHSFHHVNSIFKTVSMFEDLPKHSGILQQQNDSHAVFQQAASSS